MGLVLVIAERPMLRDVLQRAIRAWRHEPLSTCDAMFGLELALTAHPDAIVVEHDGPVLDGAGVVRELREVLRDECPRIVLISGAASDAAVPVPWGLPRSTVVIRKPYRARDLREAVSRAVPPPPVHPPAGGLSLVRLGRPGPRPWSGVVRVA